MRISWLENSTQSLPLFPSHNNNNNNNNNNMKITLNTNDIVNRLMRDDNAEWSRSGAYALAQYLEEMEDEADEEMEFDVVEIRCGYSEFSSAAEAAGEYGWAPEPDEYDDANESAALSWLQDRTSVITFDGGVIIAQF